MKILSLDTETTGVDSRHGSLPFLVTTCDNNYNIRYWEWRVDPENRKPIIPKKDVRSIEKLINSHDHIVFQNAKFDIRMLELIGISWENNWGKTRETLMSSHIINSGLPKNLTYSCIHYLGIDLSKYEKVMKKHVIKARLKAQNNYPTWRIAKKGLEDMPSATATVWKNDLWLLREMRAVDRSFPEEWDTVVSEYANSDSEATLLLYENHVQIMKEKGLLELYEERLKTIKPVYYMEKFGVSLSKKRLEKTIEKYEEITTKAKRSCINIAKSKSYELEMPKSGNNKSLTNFVFDELKFEIIKKSKKTGNPSLDSEVIQKYIDSTKPRSKQGVFIRNLQSIRLRRTAITYMEGYKRFGLERKKGWLRLYPSLNPTDTYTLRCASKNPNSQNISKKKGFNLRYAFGPEPGREWWSIDYNNLELRLAAYESGEEAMIELFEKPEDPPYYGSYHLLNASIIYPELWKKSKNDGEMFKKENPMWYRYAKEFGFAVTYGAQLKSGTADRAARKPGSHVRVLNKLKKNAKLNEYWINFAKEHGYVETIPDKTINSERGYPVYCPRDQWGNIPETKPLSNHIQSTGGWVIMQAMVKIHEYLKELEGDYSMIMQVHDELVLDFPFRKNKGNMKIVNKVKHLMEKEGENIGIPLTCGVDYHPNNWGESQ